MTRRSAVASAGCVALAAVAAAFVLRDRRDPDRLWADAQAAFRAGRRDEARASLLAIGRLRPKTAVDWVLQAQLDSAEGRIDPALDALAQVPASDPIAAQAALMAARLERGRNRLRAAESHLWRAKEIDPKLAEARKELVYVFGVQSRRREVDAEFRVLADLTPLRPDELATWALTHFTAWNPDVARDLQRFIDADPEDRHSRLALAEALVDQPGGDARALAVLAPLPESDADALALRVGLLLREGRVDEAAARLATGPAGHPALERLRGRLAVRRDDPADAAAHFKTALAAEPFDRPSALELGQALKLAGRADEAREALDRAARLSEAYNLVARTKTPTFDPRTADFAAFGRAFESAGLTTEARHWYALAIRRDPLDAKAQAGLHRLIPNRSEQ